MSRKTKQNPKLSKLIAEFEDSVQSLSPDLWVEKSYHKLISHYEEQGWPERSLQVVDIALKQYKYRIEFYITKVRLLMSLSRYEEALEIVNQAYHLSPYDVEIPLLKAKVLTIQGYEEEALLIIDELKLIFQKTDLQEILLMEAFINESMKDFEKMFYTLKEALTINPNNSKALQQIWVSVEFSKKYEESVELHTEIIDKNPYSYLAWYNLGHAHSCLGEYDKAMEALEYSFLINNKFEQGYMDCAELALQMGAYEKAFQCYSEANEMFGPDTELVAFMAECLIKLNRYKEAKNILQKTISQDPFNDEVFYYLGECYLKEENWEFALKYFLEALEIDEYREEYHAGAAKAYENLSNLRKAEIHYNKAARCGQEQSQYWAMYIKFLLQQNNLTKAEKVLLRADKYSVGADLCYCKIALQLLSGDRSGAIVGLEEVLQDDAAGSDLLFELIPSLKEDQEIRGMIRYFAV
ncbi:MAG: tetratricopeptide repeat protein [Saprospiraceae bacterium]|nr:tetratricopeptide repeat protein [Candidatus Vicinibacter affinis]MBP6172730.1 tetratricopeptide repeat protein [Saprospiraceae bacterium]MBK6573448.1 tetratricopeptide repeat protein [Candidatus Vicinibacter affinis]MBK6822075.1 tetratricopeptide repeat protein [Candidatus Vicinibacter affinis]MBK7302129.1 tetratricopeptide repeat protein [Candidatus Vicinibacter affinis]